MAWTPDFGDSFAHYTIADIATFGKWTTAPTLPTATTILEDGLQGISSGKLTRTLTGAAGHIVASRGSYTFSAGTTEVFNISGTLSQTIRLTINESTGRLILTTPDSIQHTSTQVPLVVDTLYNFELPYLYTSAAGGTLTYEVYIDGVKLLDVGSSVVIGTGVPVMSTLATFSGAVLGINKRAWVLAKAYSGSGGQWVGADLYGNVARGVLYPNADARWPNSTGGRASSPTAGTTYFEVIDEQLADTADYIQNQTDPDGSPRGSPNFLDRASWAYGSSTPGATRIPHVQLCNLVQRQNATTASYTLFLKEHVASDTTVSVAPLSAPASWAWQLNGYGTDPRNANIPWTNALVDTIEVGFEPINYT